MQYKSRVVVKNITIAGAYIYLNLYEYYHEGAEVLVLDNKDDSTEHHRKMLLVQHMMSINGCTAVHDEAMFTEK